MTFCISGVRSMKRRRQESGPRPTGFVCVCEHRVCRRERMTELEGPRYGPASLAAWQREVLDRFLSGTGHAVLAGPVGTGKSRTAGEIATAVATRPGRVLIVARNPVGRQMAASARHVGVPTLEL